ncbi:MarR family winged helix-turn-helix transcriptional regulator [Actinomadura violacea]|uniref:MarR family transcriptional regulator n=1 Tax=Actinomadura violacea TaxID=2819934 RepID=A0ABS3RZ74_9ACTN|nr:MarR family transcriptional regulator [Actinomadura violacea]MBO2462064.1 MarR family transcriptional regulator [Actinomadura violacea]
MAERSTEPPEPSRGARGRTGGDGPAQEAGLAEAEEVTTAVMAASRLLMAVSARALASIDDSLTLPQLRTLMVLAGYGPVKMALLAATLGVNPSNAMRMVDRLESVELVDRRTNPANRREVLLSLTDRGCDLVRRVASRRGAEVGALVSRLAEEERAALVSALRSLTAVADDLAVDPFEEVRRVGGLVDDPLGLSGPGVRRARSR